MKTGAVIVAAGLSSRMKEFKPLMKLGNVTMIEHVIQTFIHCGIEEIVVVTGRDSKRLSKFLKDYPVTCLVNPEYAHSEMFDSAKIGFRYLKEKCQNIFFTPADIPLFSEETVTKLLSSHAPIRKPSYQRRGGHPLLLDNSVILSILSYEGESGMKGALKACEAEMEYVEVMDRGILMDADTKEDFGRLVEYYVKTKLEK